MTGPNQSIRTVWVDQWVQNVKIWYAILPTGHGVYAIIHTPLFGYACNRGPITNSCINTSWNSGWESLRGGHLSCLGHRLPWWANTSQQKLCSAVCIPMESEAAQHYWCWNDVLLCPVLRQTLVQYSLWTYIQMIIARKFNHSFLYNQLIGTQKHYDCTQNNAST